MSKKGSKLSYWKNAIRTRSNDKTINVRTNITHTQEALSALRPSYVLAYKCAGRIDGRNMEIRKENLILPRHFSAIIEGNNVKRFMKALTNRGKC